MSDASRFTGTIPENYDTGLGPHIFHGYADDLVRRAALLDPSSVLELAAGTGIVTRRLRDTLDSGCHILATDLNPPMLDVAKAKFTSDESIEFKQADATSLPFPAASFDLLVCQFGIMFYPDIPASYAEAFRVLEPGGSYLFNVWDSWETNPYPRITHQTIEKFFPGNPPGFYRVPFSYNDPDTIRASAAEAGFNRITVSTVPLEAEIPSADNFAQGLVFGNPLYEEVISRGGDPVEIRDAVADAISRELGSRMNLQALVIQAIRD